MSSIHLLASSQLSPPQGQIFLAAAATDEAMSAVNWLTSLALAAIICTVLLRILVMLGAGQERRIPIIIGFGLATLIFFYFHGSLVDFGGNAGRSATTSG